MKEQPLCTIDDVCSATWPDAKVSSGMVVPLVKLTDASDVLCSCIDQARSGVIDGVVLLDRDIVLWVTQLE